MKKKREKLLCDRIVDDNQSWISKLGKVANIGDVAMVAYQYMLTKSLDNGIEFDKVAEFAQNSLVTDENCRQLAKLLCINNFAWSGRQVYKFDDTLSELLAGQTKDDLKLSAAALDKLPVDSFYILRKSLKFPKSLGFFFSRSEDMIYIADLSYGGESDFTFSVRADEGANISDVLGEEFAAEYGDKSRCAAESRIKQTAGIIAEYMQFVVYLCAINSEIVPVTSRAVVKRQAGQRKSLNSRSKSEVSEVGYKVGAAVRKSRDSRLKVVYEGEHAKGSKKSPHIRRSHYHSFWTGSGDDKELIVKWIDNIFVNGDKGDIDNSTVHKVE